MIDVNVLEWEYEHEELALEKLEEESSMKLVAEVSGISCCQRLVQLLQAAHPLMPSWLVQPG